MFNRISLGSFVAVIAAVIGIAGFAPVAFADAGYCGMYQCPSYQSSYTYYNPTANYGYNNYAYPYNMGTTNSYYPYTNGYSYNYQYQAPSCWITATQSSSNYNGYANPMTLQWQASGATSASISPNVGSVATNGSVTVSPANDTTYTLTVSGVGGTNTCQTVVYVPRYNYSSYYNPTNSYVYYPQQYTQQYYPSYNYGTTYYPDQYTSGYQYYNQYNYIYNPNQGGNAWYPDTTYYNDAYYPYDYQYDDMYQYGQYYNSYDYNNYGFNGYGYNSYNNYQYPYNVGGYYPYAY